MSDYIPKPDADFENWLSNFNIQFAANGVALGFTASDVSAVANHYAYWHAKYLAHQAAVAAALAASQAKDTQRKTSEAGARSYAQQLQKKPAITDAQRALFGLNIKKTPAPVPAPTEVPLVVLDFGTPGRMRVHFGSDPGDESHNHLAEGSTQVLIQFFAGATPPPTADAWSLLAVDTNSPYVQVRAVTVPTTFQYRVAYMNAKGEQGPWSATASGTISP